MARKPTGAKNYQSIGHLPKSRMGPADHSCDPGMQRIATERLRTKHDRVIAQEKLDGTNVGVAKVDGQIHAIQRAGYPASSSPFEQHHHFAKWVELNRDRFDGLLDEGERVCGEWLLQAHGTRYELPHEPFVAFDLMRELTRVTYAEFTERIERFGFIPPFLIHQGGPIAIEAALEILGEFGHHGAIDPVEGAIWRVETNRQVQPGKSNERRRVVDFVVKFVKADKVDGSYLPELTGKPPIWNVDPSELFD